MKLDLVQIKSFRNIDDLSIVPDAKLNFFLGENGSGKSSILEAIHYLGFTRSFRTSKHKNVIQHDQQGFTVFAQVNSDDVFHKLGLSRTIGDECLVSIDGLKSKSAVDLVSKLPVQIFTPQSSELIMGSPRLRRKYLDWLLFHVEQQFARKFANFRRCLLQLNASYKITHRAQSKDQEQFWLEQLSIFGDEIRGLYETLMMSEFTRFIHYNLQEFLPEYSFDITYYKGWEKDLSLKDAIVKNFERDRKRGFVSVGPHKADLRIKIGGVLAHEILSRGQVRMLVAALQIAQAQYLHLKLGKSVVFLLDDIGAELDSSKQELFINSLLNTGSQLFVTAIDRNQLSYISNYQHKKLFHVEHGQVREEI
ncbi:DNA replication/repair protein RecF [Paraglaciecola sp.]|uniref:DNA replication/repair protein RecF n=1 Tax=Paraglaciecola sp. TaxID=1920173 RepID=UPI0030F3EAB1